MNEKLINFLKEEKNSQQDLYNKYYTLNSEILVKLKKINETLPEFENKVNRKKEKLKASRNIYLILKINHK